MFLHVLYHELLNFSREEPLNPFLSDHVWLFIVFPLLGVSKKTGKPIKPRKPEKKKPIKPIKFLKKPAGSVRFRFYNQKTEKTEPNRNRKKPSKTEKTEPEPSQTEKTEPKPEKTKPKPRKPSQTGFCPKKPNRTESKPVGLTRFRFGFGFFFKKKIFRFGYFFW